MLHVKWLIVALVAWTGSPFPGVIQAESLRLEETFPDARVYRTRVDVSTTGKVLTSALGGKTQEFDLRGSAVLRYHEQRLPPAGRDARALRAIRVFEEAEVRSDVGGHTTEIRLPENAGTIVSAGRREGIVHYCPDDLLTRDALGLLDFPGDPLSIIAALPLETVELDSEWTPADWVIQMLTGIEAVESSELMCRLTEANSAAAKVTLNGSIKGQRLGANTEVKVAGVLIYDLRDSFISQAKIVYDIDAEVGTVTPGLQVRVTGQFSRAVADSATPISSALAESIPLDAPPEKLNLILAAPRWPLRVRHGRDWHLLQAVFEGTNPVVTLRLIQLGSLVCQCNVSPIAKAAPGQHTPLEQFEADIENSLGDRFKSFLERERIPTDDGRQIFRVVVDGDFTLKGEKAEATIPMNWIYYLVADRQGHQASFAFAVEPALLEALGNQDRDLVQSLQFR